MVDVDEKTRKIMKATREGRILFLKEITQKNVSIVMRKRKLGAKKIFNFPMFHKASRSAHFQGISNPLFPVKYEKRTFPTQITTTPPAFYILTTTIN